MKNMRRPAFMTREPLGDNMKDVIAVLGQHKLASVAFFGTVLVSWARIPMGTFNEASTIDAVSHVILPASGAPLALALLTAKGAHRHLGIHTAAFSILLLGATGSVLWEIFEFVVDAVFGLNWQVDNLDTMSDLIAGVLGSLVGGWLFIRAKDRR